MKLQVLAMQKAVGVTLAKHRRLAGISQEAYAHELRMHRTYYSAIERGEKNLTLHTLMRVSKGLDLTLDSLFAEANVEFKTLRAA